MATPLPCIITDLNNQKIYRYSSDDEMNKSCSTRCSHDVVPVVMGGRRRDYERAAPPHSYISVEDFSTARDLADYLLRLNHSDALYNEYFRWKGSGKFIDTKFWCRLCAMLHDDNKPVMWYSDFNKWWSHPGACRRDRWDTTITEIVKRD